MNDNYIFESIDKDKPINLVLGGGGVKGVAHIALLEFLEESEIKINSISGSSAGALVGALYASGRKPSEILAFFEETPIFKYSWFRPMKAGLFNSERYASLLSLSVKDQFEDLEIPLIVTSTNLEKGEACSFRKGNLIKPLIASCAIPGVFTPVLIEGELYADGGIMDNFPVQPYANSNLQIIGSYVAKPSSKKKGELNSIFKVSHHSNTLLLFSANRSKFESCHAMIVFPLGKYSSFDSKCIDQIYQDAKAFLENKNIEDHLKLI